MGSEPVLLKKVLMKTNGSRLTLPSAGKMVFVLTNVLLISTHVNLFYYGIAFPSYFLYQSVFFLICIVVAVHLFAVEKKIAHIHTLDLGVGLYFAYTTVNYWLLARQHSGNELLDLLIPFVLYAFVRNFRIRWLFPCALVAVGIEGTLGILQFFGLITNSNPNYVIGGSLGHPALSACSLAVLAPFLLSLYKAHKGSFLLRMLVLIAMGVLIFQLLICESRAAWLSFLAGCLFYYSQEKKFASFRVGIAKLPKPVLTAFVILIIGITSSVVYFQKQGSSSGRVFIWRKSLQLLYAAPLVGIGYQNYTYSYNLFQRQYFASGLASDLEMKLANYTEQAFSEWIETVVEKGVIGLGLLIAIFVLAYRGYRAAPDGAVRVRFAMLVAFIPLLCGWSVLKINALAIPFFLVLAELVPAGKQPLFTIRLKAPIALGLLTLLSVLLYCFAAQAAAQLQITQAIKTNSRTQMMSAYAKHYQSLSKDTHVINDYAGLLLSNGHYDECIKLLENCLHWSSNVQLFLTLGDAYLAKGEYRQALVYYRHANFFIPSKIENKLLLAKTYYKIGDYTRGDSVVTEVLRSKPKVNTLETRIKLQEIRLLFETKGL